MPVAADPAPRNRKRCSASVPPVRRNAEKMPASATAGGALDVVIEGADRVAIARQDRDGVEIGEILALDTACRVELLHSGDEFLDERHHSLRHAPLLAQALM